MTEQGKKLILVVVDILCVFVGELALLLFSLPPDNMAENMIRLYNSYNVR